jgi:hypothetical protein
MNINEKIANMDIKVTSDMSLDQHILPGSGVINFHSNTEPYDLLSTISHFYTGVRIFDIGTYKGMSALALSSNKTNLVISYDIMDFRQITIPPNVEVRLGNFYNDPVLLSSPFICFDIDPHNGIDERKFVDYLIENNYKGVVLFDDIYQSDAMTQFWNSITQPKYDYTKHNGHWSGTGIVIFE